MTWKFQSDHLPGRSRSLLEFLYRNTYLFGASWRCTRTLGLPLASTRKAAGLELRRAKEKKKKKMAPSAPSRVSHTVNHPRLAAGRNSEPPNSRLLARSSKRRLATARLCGPTVPCWREQNLVRYRKYLTRIHPLRPRYPCTHPHPPVRKFLAGFSVRQGTPNQHQNNQHQNNQ